MGPGEPTAREREVFAAVIRTGSYAGAARALFLSPNTVHRHLARLRQRLGAKHNWEAARRLGWLQVGD